MALFVLGDTHLSLGGSKPMDVFGGAWVDYVDKLRAGFQVVEETDTVVLCGDISWGMSLPEAKPELPVFAGAAAGRKILLKGNHDYWWETVAKMTRFFEAEGLENFEFLHNNCLCYRDIALCGTRGWFYGRGEEVPTTKRCSGGRSCAWRRPSRPPVTGKKSASCTIRLFIRATTVRRSPSC